MTDRKTLIKRWLFWCITAAIMVTVFINSAQNAEQSTAVSSSFSEVLFSAIVPDFQQMDEVQKVDLIKDYQFIIRKGAHFTVYAAMAFFCYLALNTHRLTFRKKLFFSVSICVIYAASDELHQLFVPGRAGRITDVLLDSAGVFTGVLAAIGIVKFIKKRLKTEGKQ